MKTTDVIALFGGMLIVAFVFFAFANAVLLNPTSPNSPVSPPSAPTGDVQIVNLSAQGINYIPGVITVKANQPVRIVANVASLQGCLRSVVFPAFNVRKIFSDGDNTVEFTPTQKGSFPFSCSMGMGRGTINVI